jgi:hypothetical protein
MRDPYAHISEVTMSTGQCQRLTFYIELLTGFCYQMLESFMATWLPLAPQQTCSEGVATQNTQVIWVAHQGRLATTGLIE